MTVKRHRSPCSPGRCPGALGPGATQRAASSRGWAPAGQHPRLIVGPSGTRGHANAPVLAQQAMMAEAPEDKVPPPAPTPPQGPLLLTDARFRLEVQLSSEPDRVPWRFWYQPSRHATNVDEFLNVMVHDIPRLLPHRNVLVLTMGGFSLLPSQFTSILRDGDAISVTSFPPHLLASYAQRNGVEGAEALEAGPSGREGGEYAAEEGAEGADGMAHAAPGEESPSGAGSKREGDGLADGRAKRRCAREPMGPSQQQAGAPEAEAGAVVPGGYVSQVAGAGAFGQAGVLGARAGSQYEVASGADGAMPDGSDAALASGSGITPALAAVLEVATLAQADAQHSMAQHALQQHLVQERSEELLRQLSPVQLRGSVAALLLAPEAAGLPSRAYGSPKDLDTATRTALRRIAANYSWKFRNMPADLQALICEDKLKVTKQCVMEFLKNSRPKVKKMPQ